MTKYSRMTEEQADFERHARRENRAIAEEEESRRYASEDAEASANSTAPSEAQSKSELPSQDG